MEESFSSVSHQLAEQTSQLSCAVDKSNSLSNTLIKCRGELQVSIERSSALEAGLGSSNIELVEYKMEVQALNEKCSGLGILIPDLNSRLKMADGRADRLGNALTSTAGKLANITVKYNSLKQSNAEAETNVKKYIVDLTDRATMLTALQEKIAESQTQLEASDAQYAGVLSELVTYQSKTSTLLSENEVLKNENLMAQEDLFERVKKCEIAKLKEMEMQSNLDAFNTETTELHQKVEGLQTHLEVSDARISDLVYESEANASEVKKLQGIVDSYSMKFLNHETLLSEASEKALNLEKQLSTEMVKYESALKIADNKSLGLQDDLMELNKLLSSEKENLDALNIDLQAATSHETELLSLVANYTSQLQTSENQVAGLNSLLSEKTVLCAELDASLDTSRVRIDELESLKDETTKHLSQLYVSLEEAQGQLIEVNKELVNGKAKAQAQVSDIEAQLVIAQSDAEKLSRALEKAQYEQGKLENEVHSSEETRVKLVVEIDKLNEEILSNAQKSTKELNELRAEMKSSADVATTKLNELKSGLALDAEKATTEMSELRAQIASDTVKTNRAAEQMREELMEKERVLGQMLVDLDKMQRVAAGYATERKQLKLELEESLSREKCLNQSLCEITDEKEWVNTSKQELESKLEVLQTKYASLIGHQNSRQKIQATQNLKTEVVKLTRLNAQLSEEAYRIKKQTGKNPSPSKTKNDNVPVPTPRKYNLRRRGKQGLCDITNKDLDICDNVIH